MLTSLLFIGALWSDVVTQNCMNIPEDANIVGVAVSRDEKEFLYCEYFYLDQSNNQAMVDYVDQQGNKFAKKIVKYENDQLRPDVTQEDFRIGELRKVWRNDKNFIVSYRKNSSKKKNIQNLEVNNVDIVDAGFDAYIRENWDALVKGESLSAGFASVPHLKTIALRLNAKKMSDCPEPSQKGEYKCFWVNIDNMLLRLFTGKLRLVYNNKKQLIIFEGIVNIKSEKGKNQNAEIRYDYAGYSQ